MKKDYFQYCDAFIILTRQGVVLTSNDARLTFDEDNYLSELNHRLMERKESMSKSKGTTGSQNGFRVIKEPGCIELPRQRAQVQANMFQFMKTKKGGRRK